MHSAAERYGFAEHLNSAACETLARLQVVLDERIRPLLTEAWETATMPDAVLGSLIPLDLMQPAGMSDEEAASSLFAGFRNFALARTEPDHGSDIAGGLSTSARREGDEWVLDGRKRWIGGAATADVLAVFARDTTDGHVKAFLVPRTADGVSLETMRSKVALRPMQNSSITLSPACSATSPRRSPSWCSCPSARMPEITPSRTPPSRRVDRPARPRDGGACPGGRRRKRHPPRARRRPVLRRCRSRLLV